MPLCGFRPPLLVKISCNPWHFVCVGPVDLLLHSKVGSWFLLQGWWTFPVLRENKEIPLCPHTTKYKGGDDYEPKNYHWLGKHLGALGVGQPSPQGSCCLPFSVIFAKRPKCPVWYCRDYRLVKEEKPPRLIPLAILLPPRTGQNVLCMIYRIAVHFSDYWSHSKFIRGILEAAYFTWCETPWSALRPEGVWSKNSDDLLI